MCQHEKIQMLTNMKKACAVKGLSHRLSTCLRAFSDTVTFSERFVNMVARRSSTYREQDIFIRLLCVSELPVDTCGGSVKLHGTTDKICIQICFTFVSTCSYLVVD